MPDPELVTAPSEQPEVLDIQSAFSVSAQAAAELAMTYIECPFGHTGSLEGFIYHPDPKVAAAGQRVLAKVVEEFNNNPELDPEALLEKVVGSSSVQRDPEREGGLLRVQPDLETPAQQLVQDSKKK
jgi:hypothetical protein